MVEIDGSIGRIHYVGYDSCFDEWHDLAELVNIPLSPSNCDNSADVMVNETPIQQYSLPPAEEGTESWGGHSEKLNYSKN